MLGAVNGNIYLTSQGDVGYIGVRTIAAYICGDWGTLRVDATLVKVLLFNKNI